MPTCYCVIFYPKKRLKLHILHRSVTTKYISTPYPSWLSVAPFPKFPATTILVLLMIGNLEFQRRGTKQHGQVVTLLACTREMAVSNLCRDTTYSAVFRVLFPVPPGKFRDVTWNYVTFASFDIQFIIYYGAIIRHVTV
jgi:hypothetical protein